MDLEMRKEIVNFAKELNDNNLDINFHITSDISVFIMSMQDLENGIGSEATVIDTAAMLLLDLSVYLAMQGIDTDGLKSRLKNAIARLSYLYLKG